MAESEREVPGYPDEAPLTRHLNIPVPKIAAATASTVITGAVIPFAGTVLSASYVTQAEVAESATEFAVYEVLVYNAAGVANAGAAATYSTKKPAEGAAKLVAFTPQALTLSATASNLIIVSGGVIVIKVTGTTMKEDKGGVLRVALTRNVKETPKEQPGV